VTPSQRLWLAAWAAMSGIVSVLYLLPEGGPPGDWQIDKLAHLAAFAAIGLAIWPATRSTGAFVGILLTSCVMAIGLEFVQAYVPGRDSSLPDVLANIAGLAAGSTGGRRLLQRAARCG
jgi:VanZ family protein